MKNYFSQLKKHIVEEIKYYDSLDSYECGEFPNDLLVGSIWAYNNLGLITEKQSYKLEQIVNKMYEYYRNWSTGNLYKKGGKNAKI